MKKILPLTVSLFIVVAGILGAGHRTIAQQAMKESLFKQARTLLQDAQEAKADLFSPRYFQKGYRLYRDAEKDFQKGKKLESIRKKLAQASVNFKRAIEITRLSRLTLDEIARAREKALKQHADEWAPELMKKADEQFLRAAMKVEDGKTNDATNIAQKGAKLYRDAELQAIKNRILHDAWTALRECKEKGMDKLAPHTYQKAQNLAAKAVSILDADRYNQDEAEQVADQAAYEARHALFLGQVVEKLRKKNADIEAYLLDVEKQFNRIGKALNMELEFDGGFQPPSLKIAESILELRQNNANNRKRIAELNDTVAKLSAEIDSLKMGKLPELKGKLAELERIVEADRKARERFQRIESMFDPSEAKILKEGDNVIIRLYGINFPSGKAVIRPQFFPLLTKVIKAISEFPNCYVRIEGHTDSRGSNKVNERLSTDRARAVVQYILANSTIDEKRITAIGYGEDRPIASNDTPEGRALNRRIDVVIIPVK